MKKKHLHEQLIAAERRAAVAEHEAATYRSQVTALLREHQRAIGAVDEHLVDTATVFISADSQAPSEAPGQCCECGTTEHGGRRFYENYKGDLFCWRCADNKKLAKEASHV